VTTPCFEPEVAAGPSLGVIIPTYNRSGYLRQAIESVLSQTRPPDEVLVVDDGSTDDTAAVCASFQSVRRVQQANQGRAAACNAGLTMVRSEFVILLDDDDMLNPRAIERHGAVVRAFPNSDLVYGRNERIDGDGAVVGEDLVGHQMPKDVVSALFRENFIRIQTVAVRREAVLDVGGFDAEMWPCDDYDLWIRLARAGKSFRYTPELVARYRIHADRVSAQHERMARAKLAVVEKNAYGLPARFTAGAHYRLGRVHLENGTPQEALAEFAKASRAARWSLRYRLYAFLARHPAMMGASYRSVRRLKSRILHGLARVGIIEQRWGSSDTT
jgi:glycosyltransferase involved in cell wall biosynthesis